MKIYISILFLLVSSFSVAQKFKTSLMLSPGISWYSSNNSEVYPYTWAIKNRGANFCFSGAIREEYYFPKIFSLGIELSYLNTNGNFGSPNPLSQPFILEEYDIYNHSLSLHSINLPVLLKLRTKDEISKGIYFNFGIGLSYIILATREIDRETGYMGSAPTNIVPIAKGTVTLKTQNNNQIGTIGILGIGKNIAIKNRIFFCEAQYRFDLNKWTYPTVNDPMNSGFDIKRECLLLHFGVTF